MIMGPFGLNGLILDISGDILFGNIPSDSSWSWRSVGKGRCG